MKIILEQTDLEEAIRNHVSGQGLNTNDKAMNIEFTNGRTETTATVELTNTETQVNSAGKAKTAEVLSDTNVMQETISAENSESEGTDELDDEDMEEEDSPQALFS